MSVELETSYTVVFEKLEESRDTDVARESRALAVEASEISELRRIVEDIATVDCFEFASC